MIGRFVADPFSRYGIAYVAPSGRRGVVTNLFDGDGVDTFDLTAARAAVAHVEGEALPWYSLPVERSDLAGLCGAA